MARKERPDLAQASVPASDVPHDFKINMRKVEMEVIDRKVYYTFLNNATMKVEMFNESMSVINGWLSFRRDMSSKLSVKVTGFLLQKSNKWVQVVDQGTQTYCDFVENNVSFMKNMLAASNFKDCPIKKGEYFIKNMVIDETAFPRATPHGLYRIDAVVVYEKTQVGKFAFYADVEQKDDDD